MKTIIVKDSMDAIDVVILKHTLIALGVPEDVFTGLVDTKMFLMYGVHIVTWSEWKQSFVEEAEDHLMRYHQ